LNRNVDKKHRNKDVSNLKVHNPFPKL
jgi:hypothetical protein